MNTPLFMQRLRLLMVIIMILPLFTLSVNVQAQSQSVGNNMAQQAIELIGTPYKLGGTSPQSGFDTSGFIQYLHQQVGITVPRKLADQVKNGSTVLKKNLAAGDVVFFKDSSGKVSFASIYVGNNQVLASTPSTKGVAYRSLTTKWATDHYLGAKRYHKLTENSEQKPQAPQQMENSSTVDSILQLARSLEGANYVFGGTTPAGFDTSGYIQYVLKEHQITIPRTVRNQWQTGVSIQQHDLQPGDLIFFDANRKFETPTNIGLFLGNNKVILTASQFGKVVEKDLKELQRYYMGAKRLTEINTIPVVTSPAPVTPPPVSSEPATPVVETSLGDQIILSGENYLGTPYKLGAKSGSGYFDCSLFVQTVFRENGISLPRSSRQQSQVGTLVKWGEWEKGDLLFFWTRASGQGTVGHVAIYAGDGKILHTWGSKGVAYSNIESNTWKSTYMGAKRVIK